MDYDITEVLARLKHFRKKVLHKTQEGFAKEIDISRSNYASIETGKVALIERNIKSICFAYGLNRDWLLYGKEPMYQQMSKEAEIMSYIGDVLSSDKKDFQKRFIRALSKLDDDGWDVIEKMINDIIEK